MSTSAGKMLKPAPTTMTTRIQARDWQRTQGLLAGEKQLSTYTFNTGVAQHYFCKVCGIKPFYVPRSNPDGMDVNLRCLDSPPTSVTVIKFDGQNWEEHAQTLAHKSKEL